jgi:hypothetical protein
VRLVVPAASYAVDARAPLPTPATSPSRSPTTQPRPGRSRSTAPPGDLQIDYLVAQGTVTLLIAYVPDATHWRVVVVGNDAVAAYRN